MVRATRPGERVFLDIARPYAKALNGVKYWAQVVDNFSQMGFTYFLQSKADIAHGFNTLHSCFKAYRHPIKYIQCNTSGENTKYVQEIANQEELIPEWTTTDMLQINGVAEQRIVTLKLCAMAMMNAAGLNQTTQQMLWPEAI